MSKPRYILQKNLPDLKAGAVFKYMLNNGVANLYDCGRYEYTEDFIKSKSDWFLPKQPEVENKEWEWTDELVKEACGRAMSEKSEGSIRTLNDLIEQFKQSKQPIKPDTKEERMNYGNEHQQSAWEVVLDYLNSVGFNHYYDGKANSPLENAISFLKSKMYTQQQLDEAIQKAFEAAREKDGLPINPTSAPPYFKYSCHVDYLQSINSKTSKHWT